MTTKYFLSSYLLGESSNNPPKLPAGFNRNAFVPCSPASKIPSATACLPDTKNRLEYRQNWKYMSESIEKPSKQIPKREPYRADVPVKRTPPPVLSHPFRVDETILTRNPAGLKLLDYPKALFVRSP